MKYSFQSVSNPLTNLPVVLTLPARAKLAAIFGQTTNADASPQQLEVKFELAGQQPIRFGSPFLKGGDTYQFAAGIGFGNSPRPSTTDLVTGENQIQGDAIINFNLPDMWFEIGTVITMQLSPQNGMSLFQDIGFFLLYDD